MAKYTGILLIVISFIGTLFFRHYTGEIIAWPFLWYLAFAIVGLAGLFLIYRSAFKAGAKSAETYQQAIAKIKATSRKIALDIDKCDFRSGSYSHQVEDAELSTLKMILPHQLSIYMDATKTETRTQSYLIYTETDSTGQRRFISHPFPVDMKTLEYYVMTKKLVLYVDRFDKTKYYFDPER